MALVVKALSGVEMGRGPTPATVPEPQEDGGVLDIIETVLKSRGFSATVPPRHR
jgi:hypothetical protein